MALCGLYKLNNKHFEQGKYANFENLVFSIGPLHFYGLKGNYTGFLKFLHNQMQRNYISKQSYSEWFGVKCSILEKLTELELFTVVVIGVYNAFKSFLT